MNGESVGREAEDTGEVTLSAAEVKALASGSPLIMEQVQLDTDIKKLESLYRVHTAAVRAAREKISADRGAIAKLEANIEGGKADIASRKDTYTEEKFSITIGKRKYTDKKEAGVALMAEATAKANTEGYTTVATFAGFELKVIKTSEGIKGIVQGRQVYAFNTYPTNTTMMMNRLMAVVEGIDNVVKVWQTTLSEVRADLAQQEAMISEPFAKQAELDKKRARYNEVMAILNPKEEQSLEDLDEDTEQEQSRSYLDDETPKQKKKKKGLMYNEHETQFMIWANGSTPAGEVKCFSRYGKVRYYEKTENGCVEISRAQYNERYDFYAEDIDRGEEQKIGQIADFDENPETNPSGSIDGNRDSGATSAFSGQAFGEELRNEIRRSVSGFDGYNRGVGYDVENPDEQEQQRTNTLTDREVLSMAADRLDTAKLTEF